MTITPAQINEICNSLSTPNEVKGRFASEMFWRGAYALEKALVEALPELPGTTNTNRHIAAPDHTETRVPALKPPISENPTITALLLEAVEDVLTGQLLDPLDVFGNRDDKGLNGYPDLKWIRERLQTAYKAALAAQENAHANTP